MTIDHASEKVKSYPVQYSVQAYTFPSADTIEDVRFDERYIHLDLVDGRVLSIPLHWLPSLQYAEPEERSKFYITEDRTAVVWDPDESSVNEILRLADYLRTR